MDEGGEVSTQHKDRSFKRLSTNFTAITYTIVASAKGKLLHVFYLHFYRACVSYGVVGSLRVPVGLCRAMVNCKQCFFLL